MNLEGIMLKLSVEALQKKILGCRISKVFMPGPRSIVLMLKKYSETMALMLDITSGRQAIYLPELLTENPDVPPAFCMLLRKHLEGGRISAVKQIGLDRIIVLEIDVLGAGGRIVTRDLVAELTGKNANIMLVHDGIIVDSLRHVGSEQSNYRLILPGKPYVGPPPDKGIDILAGEPADILDVAIAADKMTFSAALTGVTSGIGRATAQALLQAAEIPLDTAKPVEEELKRLSAEIEKLQRTFRQGDVLLRVTVSRQNRVQSILALRPAVDIEDVTVKNFTDINKAICYSVSLTPTELPLKEQLQKIVASEATKLEKKAAALLDDLADAKNAEEKRIIADTLMTNLHLLKKGQDRAILTNIYDGSDMEVYLNPLLSPTQNAQAYYKKYNKYKRAQTEIKLQLQETEEMREYISSIDAALLLASSKDELEEIRAELAAEGILKLDVKKKKAVRERTLPLRIKLGEETVLYIGKNNKQNDHVTFAIGSGRDLWFHTKGIPGSHVILKTSRPKAHDEEISAAVQFAAFFSKARSSSNVPVDCTERRFVKKPSGSKPGFVIYTNQKTYYATPEEALIESYLAGK